MNVISSKTDYYVTMASIGLLVLFSALLYYDFNRRVQADGDQIGTLRQRVNKAQRKYTNQVVWEGLDNEVPVYNNDSIRTGEYSSAVIELRDGTQIDLAENSMIVLNISEEAMDIDFAYGSIGARRGESAESGDAGTGGAPAELNIRSKDKVISIEDSDVQLSKGDAGDESEALDVVVSRGEAKLLTESGEARTVGEDERASLRGAEIQVQKISLRPLGPQNGGRLFVDASGRANINFTWQASEGAGGVRFELSRRRNFSEIVNRQTVRQNAVTATVSPGTYYWRISASGQNGQTETSEVRTLTVLKNSPIQLQSPAQNAQFSFVTAKPLVNFSWSENELARGYILELSRDRGFRSVIQDRRTKVRNTALTLDAGTYFWRVRTQTGGAGTQTISPTGTFQIVQNERTPAPVPLSPVRGRKLPAVLFKEQGVVFSWKRSADIKSTQLQIARDANFENLVLSRDARGNFTSVRTELEAGQYYWRLRGTDRGGQLTEYSDALSIELGAIEQLALVSPAAGTTADLARVRDQGLRLEWTSVQFPGTYELLVSNSAGQLAIRQQITGVSSVVRLREADEYSWKVRVLGQNGSVITESSARSLVIADALSTPTPLFPTPGSTVDVSKIDGLNLRWRGVASYFEVRLMDSQGRVLLNTRSTESRLALNNLQQLASGQHSWTVRACRSAAECAPVMTANFTITAENIAPPRVLSDDTLYIIGD